MRRKRKSEEGNAVCPESQNYNLIHNPPYPDPYLQVWHPLQPTPERCRSSLTLYRWETAMVYKPKKDAGSDAEGGSDADEEEEEKVGDEVDLKQAHLQQGDVAFGSGNMQLAFR